MINSRRKINAVMIFIFDNDKNLLLLKRIDNSAWEPVKGGANAGEDSKIAAKREVKEETGFNVFDRIEFLESVKDNVISHNGQILEVKGDVFFCFLKDIKPTPNLKLEYGDPEHNDYMWVSSSELIKIKIFPEIANELVKRIHKSPLY